MNEKPSDDLTLIKGIGPVWQRRLRESLGVYTFRDLAALSSDELLSGLKAAGQPVPSKSDCDAWIKQAQEHLAATKSSANTKSETKQTSEHTNSPAASKVWKPFATFVVEYQGLTVEGETEQRRTKVHHLETDTDANWPDIVSVELCHWMLEQSDEIASSEVEQIIEENRARAQRDLEQEVKEKRASALRELEQTLADEQTRARQVLQQELDTEGTQASKELEQQLDERRAQAELELKQQLEEERTQAQQLVEQELDERRAQAELELKQQLEEERTQAQQLVEQELDERRAQAELELKQQLEEERTQAQRLVEQELDEKQAQLELEFKQQLEEEHSQTLQELDQKQPVEVEPQPLLEEEIPSTAQPFELQPVVSEPRVELAILKLQAYQPPEATEPVGIGLPGQPFSGFISSSEMFAFAVDFELVEPTTNLDELVEQRITYHVQFYAHNISTGSKDQLGSTKAATFVEGRASYNPKLTGITLESGIYELSAVLMTIQNGHPIVNHIMVVPLLQVP